MSTSADRWPSAAPPSYQASDTAPTVNAYSATSAALPVADPALEHLRNRVLPIYQEHTLLLDTITPLLALPKLLKSTQEGLYVSKGLLTTKLTSWKRLDGRVQAAHKEYRSRKPALGKALMLPHRKRKWELARVHWERLVVEKQEVAIEVSHLQSHIQCEEKSIYSIQQGLERLSLLQKDLDDLDMSLFAGPTPTHPSDDLLESMELIVASTSRLLKAEADRESRARDQLNRVAPCLDTVHSGLKQSLAISLEVGVARDQKYSRQMFSNGGSMVLARRVTPLLQGAKTASGNAHTIFAEARGTQLLVRPLPTLRLIDLNRLSGRLTGHGREQLSERAIHASLETSFAQSLALQSHLKREVRRSRMRTDFLKRKLKELADEQNRIKALLRRRRREIILVLATEGEVAAAQEEARAQVQTSVYRTFGWHEGDDLTGEDDENDNRTPDQVEGADDDDDDTLAGDYQPNVVVHAGREAGVKHTQEASTTSPLPPEPTGQSRNGATSTSEELMILPDPSSALAVVASSANASVTLESGALPSSHPLSSAVVALRSTRALRQILRECVRDCDAGDPEGDLTEGGVPGYGWGS